MTMAILPGLGIPAYPVVEAGGLSTALFTISACLFRLRVLGSIGLAGCLDTALSISAAVRLRLGPP
jgi:hypothetical protein